MKYPGPTKLDYGLAPPRPEAPGARSREPAGPDGGARHLRRRSDRRRKRARATSAKFTVVKDPRLPTTAAEYAAQFALHKELVASLSKLKQAVNRLRG